MNIYELILPYIIYTKIPLTTWVSKARNVWRENEMICYSIGINVQCVFIPMDWTWTDMHFFFFIFPLSQLWGAHFQRTISLAKKCTFSFLSHIFQRHVLPSHLHLGLLPPTSKPHALLIIFLPFLLTTWPNYRNLHSLILSLQPLSPLKQLLLQFPQRL